MQTRPSATDLLNTIQPLTHSDNTLENARAELALFFSTLDVPHPSTLTPEEKTKLQEHVSTLRTFLLTQLIDIEKSKNENLSYPNIYTTLILLAQCFPLNKKNEHNQFLTVSSNENYKTPIADKDRFIAANGYWYRAPNVDYEGKFKDYEVDPYLRLKKDASSFSISQQDINRATLLVSQYPKTDYEASDGMIEAMMGGMGAGIVTTVILLLFLIVTTGPVAFAGLGIGIVGLIIGGTIQGATIGIAFKNTKDLISTYFKNKKINHIEVPDFAMEESKINAILYTENGDPRLPVAPKADAKKPYFSIAFKTSLSNRFSIGVVIGAVLGMVATAALLVFAGPAAIPAIAVFAILFGPSIGLPLVFGTEKILSHSVSFIKEKFKKTSVVETHDVIQPSQSQTISPDLSNTHLQTLDQLSSTHTVYPIIKKTKQDIVNIAFSKLTRNASYEKQAVELYNKVCSLIMQIKKPQYSFTDSAKTFGYATVHAAYLSAKENILEKMARKTSAEKKNVFLNNIEDVFLARMNLICNRLPMSTPTKTQLFFSAKRHKKVIKKTEDQSAKPKPVG